MKRRQFLRLTGGVILSLLVAGCGDGEEPYLTVAQGGQPIPPSSSVLGNEEIVEVDALGRIIGLDTPGGLVTVSDEQGRLLFTSRAAVLPEAAVGDATGRLFVLDRGEGVIVVLDGAGDMRRTLGGQLHGCIDLALSEGELFLLNQGRNEIEVYSVEGTLQRTLLLDEGDEPRALAVGPTGHLYLLVAAPVAVKILDPASGRVISTYGPPDGVALSARALAVNALGRSAIVDSVGDQVLLFDENKEFVSAVSVADQDGDFAQPILVSLESDGQLHVTIQEVRP